MGSKARLYGISTLLGGLMLWTSSAPQAAVSSSPVPFLQAVRNEVSIARTFAPLFQLAPAHVEVANAAPAPSPAPPTPETVVVREGQSLWDIATARGVSVEAVAEANALSNAELIRPGQRLVIPPSGAAARMQKPIRTTESPQIRTARKPARRSQPASGWIVVKQGQTLSEIADQHRTSVRTLVDTNGLRSAHSIRVGQRLLIPGRETASGGRRRMAAALLPASRNQAAVLRVAGFLWPARGVLTSRFGWRWRRHHDGIDIAAPRGTPVHAAKAGRVIFSGWYYGYGRTVIVDHGGGLTTLYGHNATLLVRNGQAVESGHLIARVGCTGHCYGSHLHFEIRVNGRAVNPLKYL